MSLASALRSVSCLLGIALTLTIAPAARAQALTSTVADGFDPNVNGTVNALAVQPDGKILIGGKFTQLAPTGGAGVPHRNLARVWPDGRIDADFVPVVGSEDEQVNAIVLDASGRIVIGGTFTHINGTGDADVHNRIARLLPSGAVDGSFKGNIQPTGPDIATSLTPEVRALALQGAKILVGGGFVHKVDDTHLLKRVLRLTENGEIDSTFVAPNPDNMVLAIAVQPSGRILIGGAFKRIPEGATDKDSEHNCLARLEGTGELDKGFKTYVNNSVAAIEVLPEGDFLIGGDFTSVSESERVDGDSAIGALRLARLTVDGNFTDTTFIGTTDGPVRAVKVQPDGRIMVGGAFRTATNVSRNFIARLLPNGTADSTFIPLPNQSVNAIALQSNGAVVFGGAFIGVTTTGAGTVLRSHIARVTSLGVLDATFRPDAGGRVRSLTLLNHTANKGMLIGGTFAAMAGESHSGIARLGADGKVVRTFKTTVNGAVVAAAEQENGQIIIVGSFTRVNGVDRSFVARLNADGEFDPSFDPAPNGQVNAVAIDGTNIYLGGNFTGLAPLGIPTPVARAYLARVGTNGALDTAFTPALNNGVLALLVESDHRLLVGGQFTSVIGAKTQVPDDRFGAVRLNTDGTVDPDFHPNVNGTVFALAKQGDKIVVGGAFQQVLTDFATVSTRWNVLRVNADGKLDDSFDPRPNDVVNTLTVLSDGSILMGGRFTTLQPKGGTTVIGETYAARIAADGTVDQAFNLGLDDNPGNEVAAVVPGLTEGSALVAGSFSTAKFGGLARSRLLLVSNAGVIDPNFTPDVSTATGAPIEALTLLSDGGVLAAGDFSGLNGTVSTSLAWFDGDGSPEFNFVPAINGPVHAVAQFPMKGSPIATQRAGFAWLQDNGQLRPTYVAGAQPTTFNIPTAIAVEPSGNLLLAGGFSINGTVQVLARFRPDGSVDTAFTPALQTGTISAIVVQSDGKILIGGTFSTFGTETRNNLARLNADNGSLDTTFNPAFNAAVNTIDLQSDGKILVGGSFTSVTPNGATTATVRFGVARLETNGDVDKNFDPSPNGNVNAVKVLSDGKILMGGTFTTFKPNGATTGTDRKYLARVDSTGALEGTDLALDSYVTRIVLQPTENRILIVGNFHSVQQAERNFIAGLKADLTLDPDFDPNPNGVVNSVSVDTTGRILLGGNFTALQPNVPGYDATIATPRFRSARLNKNGSIDTSFNPTFNSQVTLVYAYTDNSVIAIGTFNTVQPSGTLLVGGSFSKVNSVPVHNLALFSNDGSVSSTFLPEPNGAVYALLPLADGRSVVAGDFTSISGQNRNRLARFKPDDTLDASFNPGADGTVFTVARQPDGKLIVGGAFQTIAGVSRPNLARLNDDGTLDGSFSPAVSGSVQSLALQADGKVLFIVAGANATSSLRRVDASGAVDGTFQPTNDKRIDTLALQADGKIVIGGDFQTVNGEAHAYLARLKADGTIDKDAPLASNPNGAVTAVTVQADGKILFGGLFSQITENGLVYPRFGLARLAPTVLPVDLVVADASRAAVTWLRSGSSPEVSAVIAEISTDGSTWSAVGQAARVPGTSNWKVSGLPVTNRATYVRLTAAVPASPHASSGLVVAYGRIPADTGSAAPVFTSSTVVNVTSDVAFSTLITATGNPTFTATGLPAGVTLSATGKLEGLITQPGTYNVTVTATNSAGHPSVTLVLVARTAGARLGRLYNLSLRAPVAIGKPIIGGVVVSGPMTLLVRGVGPGLAAVGVDASTALPTPNLKVYKGPDLLSAYNSWGGDATVMQAMARLGAFPLSESSADAAALVNLSTGGSYTMHVSALSGDGGIGLLEFYDATVDTSGTPPRLLNISARGPITATDNVAVGFVIVGDTPKQVLIRAIGPSLPTEITDRVADPIVKLYSSHSLIARNDNWGTADTVSSLFPAASPAQISAATTAVGATGFGADSKDSVVLLTLGSGVYTAEVTSTTTGTGSVMVEVYEVQ